MNTNKKRMSVRMATAVVLLIGMVSCFNLDEEVFSDLPVDKFFKTEQDILMNAGRAYVTLQRYPEEQMLWSLTENATDEVVIPTRQDGEWFDQGRWEDIRNHKVAASNKINNQAWLMVFAAITDCNEILLLTEQSPIEFAGKEKILAEIRILRALYYYWGADNWGNIPFSINYADKGYPPQKDRTFIYNFIIDEVRANIGKLQDVPTSDSYGRITKSVAHMLLAKVYLNADAWIKEPKWEEAAKECDSVISKHYYQLADNYFDNFVIKNDTSKENIFVIPYNSILTPERFYWSTLSLNSASMATYNMLSEPWDGFVVDPTFFETYDANDQRIHSFIFGQQKDINGKDIVIDGQPFIYTPTIANYDSRLPWEGARFGKYEFQTGMIFGTEDMENDFVLFRYADVVYTKLEALWRLGRTGEYINDPDVQKIRTRAGMTPYTTGDLTETEFLNELGREFALEGHRRQDMVRFGVFGDAGWNKEASSNEYLFPIPITQIATNPNLIQNPL